MGFIAPTTTHATRSFINWSRGLTAPSTGLELTDEVKGHLDQSRREILDGNYTTRQP